MRFVAILFPRVLDNLERMPTDYFRVWIDQQNHTVEFAHDKCVLLNMLLNTNLFAQCQLDLDQQNTETYAETTDEFDEETMNFLKVRSFFTHYKHQHDMYIDNTNMRIISRSKVLFEKNVSKLLRFQTISPHDLTKEEECRMDLLRFSIDWYIEFNKNKNKKVNQIR